MLTRAELEEREARTLAPCAARAAGSAGRAHPEEEHAYRTAFQRDRDRIIHCDAFRRLEYKTQVFVNHEGDHYRTRLTHTMEVAQIARTLARALSLNEDLAEAVALAHDIGHTPFGHTGEATLDELLADDGGFEHNRQGLRVVEKLEKRYPDFDGLNLSWEVREAFASHRTAYDHPDRKSALGNAGGRAPAAAAAPVTLEAQAVAAADSVAYDSHDLDDGLRSGLLDEGALEAVALWRRAAEAAPAGLGARLRDPDMRRAQIVRALINLQVSDLVASAASRLAERGVRSVADVRACPGPLIAPSEAMREEKRELEAYLMEHFYRHYRVCRMANKARAFVEAVFNELARHPDALPPSVRERAERDGLRRAVADYVAGMTDRYCQDTYIRLFQPFERM